MPTRLVYLPSRHQIDYLTEHVRHALDQGRTVLLVTANQSARRLWDYFTAAGLRTEHLQIVDVVSSPLIAIPGPEATHLHYLGNPTALETLAKRSQRLVASLPPDERTRVHTIVHNVNAFCLYNSSDVLEEALRWLVHDLADPGMLVDLIIEEEGGLYPDLDRFLTHFADAKKALGPRMRTSGQEKHEAPKRK